MEGNGIRQILIVPKATFDRADLGFLLNEQLVVFLRAAEGVPVILTPEGPQY